MGRAKLLPAEETHSVPGIRTRYTIYFATTFLLVAAWVVVAVAAAVKNECHQTTADQQREQHAADDSDVSVKRYGFATETVPGGGGKPN